MINFVAACMYAFQIIAPICIFRFFRFSFIRYSCKNAKFGCCSKIGFKRLIKNMIALHRVT